MTPAFAHIAVPVDGSDASERGIALALELARDGGRLSFCSAVNPTLVCAPVAFGAALDPGPMLQTLDTDAEIFCRHGMDLAARASVAADMRVLHGPCIAAIDTFAAGNGSDAIVMGTHGRTGVSRAVLGSVAEGVLRRSHVPVVTVHEDARFGTGPIGVAIDASPAAHAALETAIGIASRRARSVVVINVCGPAPNARSVEAILDDAMERVRSHGVSAELVVVEGSAPARIVAEAARHGCSMIAMGTHGRGPLARAVLGSVAAAVVERSQLPVVTVRAA